MLTRVSSLVQSALMRALQSPAPINQFCLSLVYRVLRADMRQSTNTVATIKVNCHLLVYQDTPRSMCMSNMATRVDESRQVVKAMSAWAENNRNRLSHLYQPRRNFQSQGLNSVLSQERKALFKTLKSLHLTTAYKRSMCLQHSLTLQKSRVSSSERAGETVSSQFQRNEMSKVVTTVALQITLQSRTS